MINILKKSFSSWQNTNFGSKNGSKWFFVSTGFFKHEGYLMHNVKGFENEHKTKNKLKTTTLYNFVTYPKVLRGQQPGCPWDQVNWSGLWWCLLQFPCQLYEYCGSASRSSTCAAPTQWGRTGAAQETPGSSGLNH